MTASGLDVRDAIAAALSPWLPDPDARTAAARAAARAAAPFVAAREHAAWMTGFAGLRPSQAALAADQTEAQP